MFFIESQKIVIKYELKPKDSNFDEYLMLCHIIDLSSQDLRRNYCQDGHDE